MNIYMARAKGRDGRCLSVLWKSEGHSIDTQLPIGYSLPYVFMRDYSSEPQPL